MSEQTDRALDRLVHKCLVVKVEHNGEEFYTLNPGARSTRAFARFCRSYLRYVLLRHIVQAVK
jgi:hypothetical protein